MRDNQKFISALNQMEIELTEVQMGQFENYYDILLEWNSVMNLTTITEYEEVVCKHFIDSLSIVKILYEYTSYEDTQWKNEGLKLIDIGTGAGFPGIPLKIVFPNLTITLLDSLNKRIRFLDSVIEHLGLKKIEAIHGRAEELAGKLNYREQYDFCVSRAVAKLVSLSELAIPFVKVGGYFIAYKSIDIENELEEAKYAIKCFGAKTVHVSNFVLPDTDVHRSLVMIKKLSSMNIKYPRAGGKPMKQPLYEIGK